MNIDISTWLNLFFGIMYRNWSGADADKKDFIKLAYSLGFDSEYSGHTKTMYIHPLNIPPRVLSFDQ